MVLETKSFEKILNNIFEDDIILHTKHNSFESNIKRVRIQSNTIKDIIKTGKHFLTNISAKTSS